MRFTVRRAARLLAASAGGVASRTWRIPGNFDHQRINEMQLLRLGGVTSRQTALRFIGYSRQVTSR